MEYSEWYLTEHEAGLKLTGGENITLTEGGTVIAVIGNETLLDLVRTWGDKPAGRTKQGAIQALINQTPETLRAWMHEGEYSNGYAGVSQFGREDLTNEEHIEVMGHTELVEYITDKIQERDLPELIEFMGSTLEAWGWE